MNTATGASSANSATIPPEIVEVIKHNFRYTYILATQKRNAMVKDGRRNEMERLVELAREAQNELLSST